MAISYNPKIKSWSVSKEKTDYKTDYLTNYDTSRKTDYPTNLKTDYALSEYLKTDYPTNLPTNARTDYPTDAKTDRKTDRKTDYPTTKTGYIKGQPFKVFLFHNIEKNLENQRQNEESAKANAEAAEQNKKNKELNDANHAANVANAAKNAENAKLNLDNQTKNVEIQKQNQALQALNASNAKTNSDNQTLNSTNAELNRKAAELNQKNTQLNQEHTYLNTTNAAKNSLYDKTLQIVSSTKGGDYLDRRDSITAQDLINAGLPEKEAKDLVEDIKSHYKAFYTTEKLQIWDTKLGKQPPYADYLINELGVKPDKVTGTFDPNYYKLQNPNVAAAWQEAVAKDDVDITLRYGENNFYWQHYTNIGSLQGLRGNEAEDTARANAYIEEGPTDAELQQIRDKQLGVDQATTAERLLNIPEISNEWTKARQGDPYWRQLAKEKFLDPEDPEEFAILFRLSERPEDKQVSLNYNINAGSGITELEQAINEAIGAKAEIDIKKFAALNQSILKDTIAQMKKQKAEQEMLGFYKGFGTFSEVFDLTKTLADSILGDSGVGGILSFTSAGKAEEDLIGALNNVTGMRNNVQYNWEKWFDQAIKEKYGVDYSVFEPLEEKTDIINAFLDKRTTAKVWDPGTNQFSQEFLDRAGFTSTEKLIQFLEGQGDEGLKILDTIKADPGQAAEMSLVPIRSRLEADIKTLDEQKDRSLALAYSTAEKTQMMNIEADFARRYIDEYLIPRFNTSRSMDEFVEYLDVRQEEQNPFQTQDSYDALKMLSEVYTKKYLDDIKSEGPRAFDPNFYFNPTPDSYNAARYQEQKDTVEKDWEAAKAGDKYWAAQAYRFGIDINNKAAFARMHFEVKGQGLGYDPAEDIVNAGKVKDFLFDTVLPVMEEEALKGDPVFGQFITPEEFADELLRGLDPSDTPAEWKELLQRYGLEDYTSNIDELREYIIETLRTGSAQRIREEIKYLNEKRQKPTQEILGVTYIQRDEDFKNTQAKPTTQLYAVFQKAGYQGTEDEFYTNFFPDLDRSEQITLTKAGKDEALKSYGLDLSDPFASFGTVESFFPEDAEAARKEEKEKSPAENYTSYFRIGIDDDEEDEDYMSKTGQGFLDEFTSMFKGLS